MFTASTGHLPVCLLASGHVDWCLYGEWELLTCWGFTEIQNCLQIRADSTDPWALPPAYLKQKVGNPSLGVLVYPIIFMMAIGQMNGKRVRFSSWHMERGFTEWKSR